MPRLRKKTARKGSSEPQPRWRRLGTTWIFTHFATGYVVAMVALGSLFLVTAVIGTVTKDDIAAAGMVRATKGTKFFTFASHCARKCYRCFLKYRRQAGHASCVELCRKPRSSMSTFVFPIVSARQCKASSIACNGFWACFMKYTSQRRFRPPPRRFSTQTSVSGFWICRICSQAIFL